MTFIHNDDNCVYTALVLALATSTNQRRLSLPKTYVNSKHGLYSSTRTYISHRNFHLYQTAANNNGPLLGYISPSRSNVSGLIYANRMIICFQ